MLSFSQKNILVFPEGTRSQLNHLLPFKKKAFHIAVQGQLPIQPVVVAKYIIFDHSNKMFKSQKIIVQILPIIPVEGLDSSNSINDLVEKTYKIMNEKFLESI